MTLEGLLANAPGARTYGGDFWDTVGVQGIAGGDTTDYFTQGQAELDFLRKFGMTPQEAKAKGLQLVTGDYGDNKFVSALVDPNGQIIGQQITDKTDKMGMLGQFALGSLAMGAGIAALGLPLTPSAAAAAGGAASSGGAVGGGVGSVGGGAASGGGLLGEYALSPLTGAAAESAGTALTGSTIGGMGTGLGGIEAGLLASGGLGSGLGLSPSAGLGALTSVGGAAANSGLLGKAGSALGSLGGSDLLKAGLIGAGAVAGAQKQPGDELKQQNKLDPRMDNYLYGTGGLLPEAMNWYNQNKSGVNPTMQQGWNMQLGILTDPRVSQTLGGMMSRFGQPVPVASNPFMRGK